MSNSPLVADAPPAVPDTDIVVTRQIPAPCELVFDAFTDPKGISDWWGPVGFATTTHTMDFRVGGTWRFTMHGPDGTDFENEIVYEEIENPRKLAYRHAGLGATAHIQFRSTVTFEPRDGGTFVTLRARYATADARDQNVREVGAVEGGRQTLSRLEARMTNMLQHAATRMLLALPSQTEIRLVRVLDAPRELVFEAFSKPEHLRRWWGSAAFEMPVCEIDFRVGGAWRIVQREVSGTEHPFCGVYRTIEQPELIEYTFIYDTEATRDFVAVESILLHPLGNRTAVINTMTHGSRSARDGMISAGMESGAAESFDRLADLVMRLSS